MTIRKQLMIIIIFMIFLAIALNSLISSQFIDNYFSGYISEQYDSDVKKIKNLSIVLLNSGKSSQAESELENYIEDPIVQISVYDVAGNELLSVQDRMYTMHSKMMMKNRNLEQDEFELENDGEQVGHLIIVRTGSIQSSENVVLFKSALRFGTLLSSLIVLIIAVIATIYISSRMTKDLRKTAQLANNIELDTGGQVEQSKIIEIKAIQASLFDLSSKLKLQKSVRKEKADQLAHEARTPLTILKTHCEGVLDGVVEMDLARLESCLNEINNLSGIVSNINSVVEYHDQALNPNLESFDLAEELRKIVKGLKLQFEKKNIALRLTVIDQLEVKLDKALISQTVYNLLTNAYKFTHEGGIVEIKVALEDLLKIEVIDNGRGISEGDVERIFEAYYRGTNTNATNGEGLGLYIAKRNIQALGGSISVTSKVGVSSGTKFMISLPYNS